MNERLQVYRPVRTNRLTQDFGDNKACVKTDVRNNVVFPYKFVRSIGNTCPAGSRSLYKAMNMEGHNGKDWAGIRGEGIYHAYNFMGVVKNEVDATGGLGVNVISIQQMILDDPEHPVNIKVKYWHCKSHELPDGMVVQPGALLATLDNTGSSSGDHTHVGEKQVSYLAGNHYDHLKTHDRWEVMNRGNGYYGAIDTKKYFTNKFIGDVTTLKYTEDQIQRGVTKESLLIKLKRQLILFQIKLARLKLDEIIKSLGGILWQKPKQRVDLAQKKL